eukprot:gene45029-4770_t
MPDDTTPATGVAATDSAGGAQRLADAVGRYAEHYAPDSGDTDGSPLHGADNKMMGHRVAALFAGVCTAGKMEEGKMEEGKMEGVKDEDGAVRAPACCPSESSRRWASRGGGAAVAGIRLRAVTALPCHATALPPTAPPAPPTVPPLVEPFWAPTDLPTDQG